MSGFGIAGSHRSGKTTLARAVAERLGFEYLEANVAGVFETLGFSPKDELSFDVRLEVQDEILKSLESKYKGASKDFITDRTPIDVLGYTMAEVMRGTVVGSEKQSKVMSHINAATRITAEHLSGVLVVRPIYGAQESATSAQACPFYMQHVFACISEAAQEMTITNRRTLIALTETMDHDGRVENLVNLINQLTGTPKI